MEGGRKNEKYHTSHNSDSPRPHGGIDIPLSALRSQVASAIDAVVHTARLSDGSRKVVSVAEVMPLAAGEYQVREIRRWHTDSIAPDGRVAGHFEAVEPPTFVEQAKIVGVEVG